MARRDFSYIARCAHDGCTETTTYRYSTRRDMMASHEVKNGDGWRCIRHSKPEEVLSLTNTKTVAVLRNEEKTYGKFFGDSGFVYGPGFKVWSSDLPVGAMIMVTAEIILPKDDANA